MTCKELLKLHNPQPSIDFISDDWVGGCKGCPSEYGYLEDPPYCPNKQNGTRKSNDALCTTCWGREVPEYNKNAILKEDIIDKINSVGNINSIFPDEMHTSIKDSGDRTEFDTGAVRDMREGKGRCDLMPLEVVAKMLSLKGTMDDLDLVIGSVALFNNTNDTIYLYRALNYFSSRRYLGNIPEMFLEVSKHFEEGAKKYGESNYKLGIPTWCYIDSAVRHYLKWLRGDKDEPHDRAFVWNLMCCIWEVDYHEGANKCDNTQEDT